jgi:hypothetical protein
LPYLDKLQNKNLNEFDLEFTNHISRIPGIDHEALIKKFRQLKTVKFQDCMDVVIEKRNIKNVLGTANDLMLLMKDYSRLREPEPIEAEEEEPAQEEGEEAAQEAQEDEDREEA